MLQMVGNVPHCYAVEVVDLAAGEYCRYYLVLFGCGKDEYDIRRRFLKGLEESVEGRLREHVHLIYDEHAVASLCGGYHYLIHEVADVAHAVAGGGVEFENVQ